MSDAADQFLVGDWKSFRFHAASVENCEQIIQHIGEHLIPHEPPSRYLLGGRAWSADHQADFTDVVKLMLQDGHSFYVTPKDSDEIIAVNVVADSRSPESTFFTNPRSEIIKILNCMFQPLETEANKIFQSRFTCEHYAEFCFTSVHSDFTGHGIATEMYARGLKFLKTKGFPVIKGVFTHPGTQRIGQKLGFDELGKFYLKDRIGTDGKKLFPDAKEDEVIVFMARNL